MREHKNMLPGNALTVLLVFGSFAPFIILAMLWFIGGETVEFFEHNSWRELLAFTWQPFAETYGVLPLVAATIALAGIATGFAILIGTPAAIALVFFAGKRERMICETALSVMAGLPSVIVGLAGLFLLVPTLGLTMISGSLTLFVMTFPVYTLLAVGALRQEGARLWPTGQALGYTKRQFAYRILCRAVSPTLISSATLSFGKAAGEATAVSLVIGNKSPGLMLELLGPTQTLTTAILSDHSAASGSHLSALYVAAFVLSALILLINLAGAGLASATRRFLI